MGTITGSQIDVRGGSGSITLTESTLPTTDAEVSSIGDIEADFDVESEDQNAGEVFLKLGQFKFSMFDGLANGDSLFNELNNVSATSRIDVEFSFTTNASRSWTDGFYFFPRDVNYNRDRREVTIEAYQEALFTDSVEDIFVDNSGDVYDISFYGSDPGVEDCMPASDFIENVLPLFNSSNTSFNNSFIFDDVAQTDNEESYVILRRSTGEAKDELFRLASAEGSLVGSFMGYNFYTNRLTTANSVTLSEDDIKEETLNIKIGLNSYLTVREVFDMGVSDYYSFYELTGDSDDLNSEAMKRLDIFFRSGILEDVSWDAANSRYQGFASSPNSEDQTEATVDGGESEGSIAVYVSTGAGSTINDGDYVWFENINNFGAEPTPFYITDGGVGSNTLGLQSPLIKEVQNGWRVYRFNDVGVNDIAEQGVKSYSAAYGASGKQMIELTVFGIDSVKPYQSITFDSSLPDAIAGKTYRPSKLNYKFEEDAIVIEAYEI